MLRVFIFVIALIKSRDMTCKTYSYAHRYLGQTTNEATITNNGTHANVGGRDSDVIEAVVTHPLSFIIRRPTLNRKRMALPNFWLVQRQLLFIQDVYLRKLRCVKNKIT